MAGMGEKETLELGDVLIAKRIPDAAPEPVTHIRNNMVLIQFGGVVDPSDMAWSALAAEGFLQQNQRVSF